MSTSDPASGSRASLLARLLALFGKEPASLRDDIEDALEEGTTATEFSPQERAMLKNVLGLHEKRVDDVMVPLADIIAVSEDATLAEVLSVFRTAGHSRLPVHGETIDDPRGMVHIRDFVNFVAELVEAQPRRPRTDAQLADSRAVQFRRLDLSAPLSAARILRPVHYVPRSMPALDLLVRMQATRTHMALVIDEYGGTDGLVSMEDIVETIVGDIEDEHDVDERPVVERAADGSLLVDARIGLDDIGRELGRDLSNIPVAEEVDTLGGLVTTLAGRVPLRGEIVAGADGLEFEVIDADPRRLKRIRVRSAPSAGPIDPTYAGTPAPSVQPPPAP